ncbi:MAG: tetratricopeptide repeat protein [Bacteroidota bacterium]|nr:tetratricopeptide repeat protein [Bacteroidota bacterium]
MKRTHYTVFSAVVFALVLLATTGFQCSSPNITSGKMYFQQYQNSRDTAKLNLAIEAFQREVTEKPNSAEGWYWLGFAYGIKKDYIRLEQAWKKSKSLGPAMASEISNNTPYFWQQAYLQGTTTYKKAGLKKDKSLFREAAETLQAAGALAPDTSAKYEAFIIEAYARLQAGDEEGAVKALEKQNMHKPHPEAHRFLGQLMVTKANRLKNEGKTKEAENAYSEAINYLNTAVLSFPNHSELNQEMLNAYVAAGRIVEAKERFHAFADNNPKDKMAQYAYGTVLLETKEYEAAAGYLQKAIDLDPKFENALYNSCVAYLRWGIKVRDEESAANPEKQPVKYKQILEKALPNLKTLLEMKPDVLANWELAGKIYASLGMTNEAEEAYRKADELRSK